MKKITTDKSKKQKILDGLFAVIIVSILYIALQIMGITCPIKFVTGISCPGCGMTRSILAAIQFNFGNAFNYHPLFWLPPLWVVLFLLRGRISKRIFKIMMFTSVALFCIIYINRMFFIHNDIVVFEPQNGLITRILRIICRC